MISDLLFENKYVNPNYRRLAWHLYFNDSTGITMKPNYYFTTAAPQTKSQEAASSISGSAVRHIRIRGVSALTLTLKIADADVYQRF